MLREIITSETESKLKKPSMARKALMNTLGGIGIFVASNIYGAAAGIHNDHIRDAEAKEAHQFDLSRAKVVHAINLDENCEEIEDNGVPVAVR